MSNERRRITWSEMEYGSLDPFLVDKCGRVFKKKKRAAAKPREPMSLEKAVATWQKEGFSEPWTDQDPPQPRPIRRRPTTEPGHLLSGTNETVWVYHDQWPQETWINDKGRRIARLVPNEWLPAAGDRYAGWYVLTIEGRFRTLFHGPSMALRCFPE